MAKKRSRFPVPRRTVRLEVVADPDPKRVPVVNVEVLPALRGVGGVDYACGGCGAVLCEACTPGELRQLVFACPECGAHSTAGAAQVG
jgi:hypothetical protein